MRFWTQGEELFLKENYPTNGKLWCADSLGRSEASVRKKAATLGLRLSRGSKFYTDFQKRAALGKVGRKHGADTRKKMSVAATGRRFSTEAKRKVGAASRSRIKKNGHPKGMAGKKQTQKCRDAVSKASKKMWADPNSHVNTEEYRQMLSDRSLAMMHRRIRDKGNTYSRSKNGWYEIAGEKYYFRSGWEVNYGRFMQFLLEHNEIKAWEFEKDVFWFENIKRGVRSYLPDFKVHNLDGSMEYHEVKGWMDAKSKTKIKRMAKYYPEVKLLIIGKDEYKEVLKNERLYPEAIKLENYEQK